MWRFGRRDAKYSHIYQFVINMTLDSGPTTREELRDELDELLVQAEMNGVPIDEQRYVLRHDALDSSDWVVEIVPLADKIDYSGNIE